MTVHTVFERGETVPIWCEVKDWNDSYVTPTSVVVTVTSDGGAVGVNSQSMDADATGKYVYYWGTNTTDAFGKWKAKVTITDGTGAAARKTIPETEFYLR